MMVMLVTTNKQDVIAVDSPPETYAELCSQFKRCALLREVAYFESRSESDEGVAAVIHVVLNRVNHPKQWGDNVFDVVYQKAQFSYVWDGSLDRGVLEKQQIERLSKIVVGVLTGEIKDNTMGAMFYHTISLKKPVWTKKLKQTVVIGNHIFYKKG